MPQVGTVRRYSADDEVEGLLRMVRVDHNIPPTTPFARLISVPGNRRVASRHFIFVLVDADAAGGAGLGTAALFREIFVSSNLQADAAGAAGLGYHLLSLALTCYHLLSLKVLE